MKLSLDGMGRESKGEEAEVGTGVGGKERLRKEGGKRTLKRKKSLESRSYLDEGSWVDHGTWPEHRFVTKLPS